jgi:hypothetical protein
MDGASWTDPLLRGIAGTVLLAVLAAIAWWRFTPIEESSSDAFDSEMD